MLRPAISSDLVPPATVTRKGSERRTVHVPFSNFDTTCTCRWPPVFTKYVEMMNDLMVRIRHHVSYNPSSMSSREAGECKRIAIVLTSEVLYLAYAMHTALEQHPHSQGSDEYFANIRNYLSEFQSTWDSLFLMRGWCLGVEAFHCRFFLPEPLFDKTKLRALYDVSVNE